MPHPKKNKTKKNAWTSESLKWNRCEDKAPGWCCVYACLCWNGWVNGAFLWPCWLKTLLVDPIKVPPDWTEGPVYWEAERCFKKKKWGDSSCCEEVLDCLWCEAAGFKDLPTFLLGKIWELAAVEMIGAGRRSFLNEMNDSSSMRFH